MRNLTNSYQDMQVWDLAPHNEARGPLLVSQVGLAPGDLAMCESLFVLRPDGLWVDVNVYLSSDTPDAIEEALFDTTEQVMQLLDALAPEVKVADLPISEARLQAWLDAHPAGTALEQTHEWLALYREQRKRRGRGE